MAQLRNLPFRALLWVPILLLAIGACAAVSALTGMPWDLIRNCQDCTPSIYPGGPLWPESLLILLASAISLTAAGFCYRLYRGEVTASQPAPSIALLSVIAACTGAFPLSRYAGLGSCQIVLFALIAAAAALFLRTEAKPSRVLNPHGSRHSVKSSLIALSTFLCVFALACAVSRYVFHSTPLFSDTRAALAQANLYAFGLLKGSDGARIPGAYRGFGIINASGTWYSVFSPGHPLLLAAGIVLGNNESLVNPILCAAGAALMSALGCRLYGKRVALMTGLLFCSSPWFLLVAGEYLSHAATFFLFSTALYGTAAWHESKRPRYLCVVAAGIAGMVITRPFTALALSAPLYLFLLCSKPRRAVILYTVAGGAAGLAVILWHNYQLSGDPLTSGYGVYLGPGQAPGFGERGAGRGYHTLTDGIYYLFLNLRSLNTWVFAWPIPSLSLFVVPLLKKKLAPVEALCLGCFLSLAAAHIAYWDFLDELLGPRFLFESIGILILFSARGYCIVEDSVPAGLPRIILGTLLLGSVGLGWWLILSSFVPGIQIS